MLVLTEIKTLSRTTIPSSSALSVCSWPFHELGDKLSSGVKAELRQGCPSGNLAGCTLHAHYDRQQPMLLQTGIASTNSRVFRSGSHLPVSGYFHSSLVSGFRSSKIPWTMRLLSVALDFAPLYVTPWCGFAIDIELVPYNLHPSPSLHPSRPFCINLLQHRWTGSTILFCMKRESVRIGRQCTTDAVMNSPI